MIVEEFSIQSSARLEQFEAVLTQELKNSALRRPIAEVSSGNYSVSLRCVI